MKLLTSRKQLMDSMLLTLSMPLTRHKLLMMPMLPTLFTVVLMRKKLTTIFSRSTPWTHLLMSRKQLMDSMLPTLSKTLTRLKFHTTPMLLTHSMELLMNRRQLMDSMSSTLSRLLTSLWQLMMLTQPALS